MNESTLLLHNQHAKDIFSREGWRSGSHLWSVMRSMDREKFNLNFDRLCVSIQLDYFEDDAVRHSSLVAYLIGMID